MDMPRCSSTMRAFTAHFLAGVAIALMMAPASSRLSATIAEHHAAGSRAAGSPYSTPDQCTSRPDWEMGEGCGQCAHLLARHIVQDKDAWLLVVYANRGHLIPNRNLRGRSRFLKARQLPHQYFVNAMDEALGAIAETEPGAKVNIAVFSEARVGGMVDEHGAPVGWGVTHELCDRAGVDCTKTEVLLDQSTSMEDAVQCMSSADIFIASDDEFSHRAATMSHNVRVVTPRQALAEDDEMIVLSPGSAVTGLSHVERSEFRGVVHQWREFSLAMRESMLESS